MSQNAIVIPNASPLSGLQLIADTNAALDTLNTFWSGASAPGSPEAGQPWHDTTNNLYKIRNLANSAWITVGGFDETNNIWLNPIGGGTATIASASTVDLGSTNAQSISISGVVTVTSFGTSMLPGQAKIVTATGAFQITYNATSMILPGAANFTTTAGDTFLVLCLASGNYRILAYQLGASAPDSASNQTANTASLKLANMSSVQASMLGGLINQVYNGGLHCWTRGTSGTITSGTTAIAADGIAISCTGANVPWAQVAGRASTAWALKATGATSVTDVAFKGRIESYLCNNLYPQASAQVTIQAKIYNNTGGSITPTLTIKHATAQDNWTSTTTDVSAVNLQACPNTTLTQVAYTFASASGTTNGLEWTIDCGNNFSTNGKSVEISEIEVRVTPGVATGLNSTPPVPELRNVAFEDLLCQRYLPYVKSISTTSAIGFAAEISTTQATIYIRFQSHARIAPTSVTADASNHITIQHGNTVCSAVAFVNACQEGAVIQVTFASGGVAGYASYCYFNNASAYLYFPGAELF